jgi:hypothetical protein
MWISKFVHFTCKVGLIDKISSGFDVFVEGLLTHVFLQSLSRESNKEGQLATLNLMVSFTFKLHNYKIYV